jgi:carboxylesterase type B
MRALSPSQLFTARPTVVDIAGPSIGWLPAVDGYVLKADPLSVIQTGQHNKIPVIVGSAAQETALNISPSLSGVDYITQANALFPRDPVLATAALDKYRRRNYGGSNWQASTALTTDYRFTCAARRVARAFVSGQTQPVYRFFFTHPIPVSGYGSLAFHGIDIPFIFYSSTTLGYTLTSSETTLSQSMVTYWAALASTGTLDGIGTIAWLRYASGSDSYLEFATPNVAHNAPSDGVRTALCDFWDAH